MLTKSTGAGFAPTKLETVQLQPIETGKQILCPLITEAALTNPGVNEKVVEKRRSQHAIITS
jgi:hypothetical protein